MKGPYSNLHDLVAPPTIYIERGSCTWPQAQKEARWELDTVDTWPYLVMHYMGVKTAYVSDDREWVHLGEDACREDAEDNLEPGESLPDDWQPCCREIEAWVFEGRIS